MDTYVTVQGNLTADPIGRTTATGATVARLRIASNARRFDRETGEFRDADPLYIGVSCWRALAVNVLASLRKGDSVVVSGKLLFREYDDAQGVRQSRHEIDAVAVGPDLNRAPVDVRRRERPQQEAAAATAAPVADSAAQPDRVDAAAAA
ncbi:MAG TPA: single-stranded DNA-binding protein [Mycobacteriales bacterium]|jgi:single-strand DNA-binding protein|nr:single-stranded DNA-binding protein [Mycobacteriales bacterium]